ncbi:MAG: hypothetical protein U0R50_13395 [Gaiellales bacterium]
MNEREAHDVDQWLEELDVEEIWITDWAALGIEMIERYLAKQAAFAAYLHSHHLDLDSGDGDGRTSC